MPIIRKKLYTAEYRTVIGGTYTYFAMKYTTMVFEKVNWVLKPCGLWVKKKMNNSLESIAFRLTGDAYVDLLSFLYIFKSDPLFIVGAVARNKYLYNLQFFRFWVFMNALTIQE